LSTIAYVTLCDESVVLVAINCMDMVTTGAVTYYFIKNKIKIYKKRGLKKTGEKR
jgi:hypothetical protein